MNDLNRFYLRFMAHRRKYTNALIILLMVATAATGSIGLFYFTMGAALYHLLDKLMFKRESLRVSHPVFTDFLKSHFLKDIFTFRE